MFIPIDLITSRQPGPFIIHACEKPGKGELALSQKKKKNPNLFIFSIQIERI